MYVCMQKGLVSKDQRQCEDVQGSSCCAHGHMRCHVTAANLDFQQSVTLQERHHVEKLSPKRGVVIQLSFMRKRINM